MRVLNKSTDKLTPGAVYVGRPSIFGNPFHIGRDGTRDEVVDAYERWIRSDPRRMRLVRSLAGHDLVCWCAPLRCHADVLVALVDELPGRWDGHESY
jgi:hypothetical protein